MPLSPSSVSRERSHVRRVTYTGFVRVDGLLDIEANIVDVKDRDNALASGIRKAGDDLHNISVRVTIDRALNVKAVEAAHDENPYPGYCNTIVPDYQQLVGLNLAQHFRLHLNDRVGGLKGCTHVNEMLNWLPSAAFQTLAGERKDFDANSEQKPFQLDRCHALNTTGPAVAKFYPKWHVRGHLKDAAQGANP
jgi:Protein of unknown function (DUF2889)